MYNNQYHNAELSKYSFLVTGGAGFIGSNLVKYLLKYGAGKVRVLVSFLTGYRRNIEPFLDDPAFELMEGNIRDIEVCKNALIGIDYVTESQKGDVGHSLANIDEAGNILGYKPLIGFKEGIRTTIESFNYH